MIYQHKYVLINILRFVINIVNVGQRSGRQPNYESPLERSGSVSSRLDHTDEINLTDNVFAFARFRLLFPLFLVLFFDQSERDRT